MWTVTHVNQIQDTLVLECYRLLGRPVIEVRLHLKNTIMKLFKSLLGFLDVLLGNYKLCYFESHTTETHHVVQLYFCA